MLINFEEIGLGSWKLAFRLILGWRIRWWTQNRKMFNTWYHLWRPSVPMGPKKYQMLINLEEIGVGSWKLAFRLILGWGIRWCTQNRNIFKTWYRWHHSLPLGPKKYKFTINLWNALKFEKNWVKRWNHLTAFVLSFFEGINFGPIYDIIWVNAVKMGQSS